ncbi:MAG TPA: sigma-70 family RNA polymerase sigma factor [Candidatus Limnocylindria bacterium]|nr:sigma-70 family RNA polymerase sigma factor [Candidatus Limnocylindria bacterium]
MQSPEDSALLRQYAESQSDEAFAALVARHVNLVYSVAVRCVGDRHQAEDVAQAVFVLLGKKAGQLRHEKALSSWLFQTTRLTASNHVRRETRRQRREQEAHMQTMFNGPAGDCWPQIAPLLDDAVAALNATDHRAIVLRFYEGRTLREVGAALGSGEAAAEKRVSRALEKLRAAFARRGVTVGAGGLGTVIAANAAAAAPTGLAATISTAVAVAPPAIAAGTAMTAIKTIAMTTLQKSLLTAALVTVTGVGLYEARQATALRTQVGLLQQQLATSEAALATASTPATAATNPSGVRFGWKSVDSADYRQYLAGLRAAGYPEEVIRSLIRADVNQLYGGRMKALRQTAPRYEYWKHLDFILTGAGRDAWGRMLALNEEREAALRTLGVEPETTRQEAKNALLMDWRLDYLSEDHKNQLQRLNQELEDRLMMSETAGLEQILQLHRDQNDAVKRLLTPEEALQYDLRKANGTAGRVLSNMGCLEMTEPEFVAVFKLRREFEQQFPDLFSEVPTYNPANLTEAQRQAIQEATHKVELQIQEQLPAVLGPERYAEYEISRNPAYVEIYRFAKQAGFGTSEARQLYQARLNAEAQAAALKTDPGLSAEARQMELSGLRQATEHVLLGVLGEKPWEKFGRLANKSWLDSLDQPADPTP